MSMCDGEDREDRHAAFITALMSRIRDMAELMDLPFRAEEDWCAVLADEARRIVVDRENGIPLGRLLLQPTAREIAMRMRAYLLTNEEGQ